MCIRDRYKVWKRKCYGEHHRDGSAHDDALQCEEDGKPQGQTDNSRRLLGSPADGTDVGARREKKKRQRLDQEYDSCLTSALFRTTAVAGTSEKVHLVEQATRSSGEYVRRCSDNTKPPSAKSTAEVKLASPAGFEPALAT